METDEDIDAYLDKILADDRRTLTVYTRVRNAAVKLVARQGFAATSVRAIAKEAGVSAGVVQHHFASKAALREEITGYAARAVRDALHQADEASLIERAREQAPIWRVLARGVADGDEQALAVFDAIVGKSGVDVAVRVLGEVLFAPGVERHRDA